jgi:hypothetical protein
MVFKSRVPIAKKEFCRMNPDTGEPFKTWDERPSKNIDSYISKTTRKKMWIADKTPYIDKNGATRYTVKRYPLEDGMIFVKYLTNGKKLNDEHKKLDRHGFYFEHWTVPKEIPCDDCGNIFSALRVNTSDNKKSRGNYCQKNTMREGTLSEWRERGWAQCLRTELIAKITKCPGDKIPIEDFKVVKHSVYGTDQLVGYCRKCEKVRAHTNGARRTFSVTPEQYYEQLKKQDFHCMICTLEVSFDKTALAVDHDHDYDDSDTLQFNRGLLCKSCNQLVGDRGVQENIDIAENLYHYLLRAELLKKQFKDHPELLEQGGFPQVKEEPTD